MAYFEQSEWNNVRLQKQHERELFEKKIEQRRQFMNDSASSSELSVSAYGMQKAELVVKLRSMFDRILPNLPDNEYIILIDKYSLVERGYPFDKQTIEDIVKYLQTYKKYMSMSMVDTKKLMEEQIDYQKIVQRDSVTTSVPDMLIPPSIPISHVSPSIQVTPIQPHVTQDNTTFSVIQSTPIKHDATAVTATPDSFYFASTPISVLNHTNTSFVSPTQYTDTNTTTPIRLHIEPVVSMEHNSVANNVSSVSSTNVTSSASSASSTSSTNVTSSASSTNVTENTITTPVSGTNVVTPSVSLTIEDIANSIHTEQSIKQVVEYVPNKHNDDTVAIIMPSKDFGSPTSFTINYVTEKSIETDVSRPIYFTSFLCTDSLIRRYKLHTMPYVLLVINSKYKIPLYLNRNPNGYYEFHKRKGPFYASRVNIQLFNHVNEPIQFKNTPMELCHIQFETLID